MPIKNHNPGCPCCGGSGYVYPVGTIPNCFCTAIPATISMTSADETCNYRMFQSCTLQYGPTPAEFSALSLGANCFLSTQEFPDPFAVGALFYYYLTCQYNQFVLSRVYPTSPFGSPYRDGILYTWLIGGNGNNCKNGQIRNTAYDDYQACVNAHPGHAADCGTAPPQFIPDPNPAFHLDNGRAFPGSDASCSVKIDE